jgi:hypothetical protein
MLNTPPSREVVSQPIRCGTAGSVDPAVGSVSLPTSGRPKRRPHFAAFRVARFLASIFWKSRTSKWLLLSSAADIVVVSILASRGILMEAIPPQVVFGVLIACGCYLTAVDFVKTGLLRKLPQAL